MPKQEKIDVVAEYGQLFKDSDSFFVTDYQGLNVSDMTDLRRELRKNNVRMLFGKNTLFRIAAKEAQIEGLDEHLLGPTAIAFTSDDPAVAAKILNESFKKNDLPRMKVFSLEDTIFDGSEIGRLADLPPKDVLYAKLAATVAAPLTNLAGVVSALFRDLIGTLKAVEEQKGEQS